MTGDQPSWNENRTVACVFNGEIYNYRQLRTSLLASRHRLVSTGDTEVLVHLYEDYGADLVRHLRGMYAFAIYDVRRRRLILGRDRLGMKPLYIARPTGKLAFSSSIRSLLALGICQDPDEAALAQYLQFHKVPEPRTAYRSISALMPGHVLTVDLTTGNEEAHSFNDCDPPIRVSHTAEAVWAARSAFGRAIASHLTADVEVGAFLSGGIDSSLVVAEAQRICQQPIRTFSVSFSGRFDESKYADQVAHRLGTRHSTLEMPPVNRELLCEALAATDQPFAVTSFLPMLILSKRAASDVKVVLTGDGGDEVGFGYPWYRWMRLTRAVRHGRLPSWLANSIMLRAERGCSRSPRLRSLRRAARFARGALMPGPAASDAWRYDLSADQAVRLLLPEHRGPALTEALRSPTELAWSGDGMEALRFADLKVSLRDEMLPKLDRAGMAHGLEGRVPLLDDEFVDAMLAVPSEAHFANPKGKTLLREWAEEAVPGVDFNRPKHGFDVPIADWLRTTLRPDVDRLLLHPLRPGIVDPVAVRPVWRRLEGGVPGAAHTLYAMLLAELWFGSEER